MRILPSNHSLILAGEQPESRWPSVPVGQASRLVAADPGLQRVTILASADATVVVHADYYSRNDGASADAAGVPIEQRANPPPVVSYAGTAGSGSAGSAGGAPSYLNPIQLYARTQRGFAEAPRAALLDVHA